MTIDKFNEYNDSDDEEMINLLLFKDNNHDLGLPGKSSQFNMEFTNGIIALQKKKTSSHQRVKDQERIERM